MLRTQPAISQQPNDNHFLSNILFVLSPQFHSQITSHITKRCMLNKNNISEYFYTIHNTAAIRGKNEKINLPVMLSLESRNNLTLPKPYLLLSVLAYLSLHSIKDRTQKSNPKFDMQSNFHDYSKFVFFRFEGIGIALSQLLLTDISNSF